MVEPFNPNPMKDIAIYLGYLLIVVCLPAYFWFAALKAEHGQNLYFAEYWPVLFYIAVAFLAGYYIIEQIKRLVR